MPGLAQRNELFSNGSSPMYLFSSANGFWSKHHDHVGYNQLQKSEDTSWDLLKPGTFAAIMDFYSSGQPLFLDTETVSAKDTAIHEDDSETVAMIKELLETPIRPVVQDDGGDIEYRGFDLETGIVTLRMQGACSGCPSSSVTLKLTQLEHVPVANM